MMSFTSSNRRFGFRARTSAATPATPGAALEVPPKLLVKFPADAPFVITPGLYPTVPVRSVVQIPGVFDGKALLLGKQHQTALPTSLYGLFLLTSLQAATAMTLSKLA